MGLIIGIIIIVIGFILSLFIGFANGMAAAPSVDNSISPWPLLIVSIVAGGVFIFTHYYHIGW